MIEKKKTVRKWPAMPRRAKIANRQKKLSNETVAMCLVDDQGRFLGEENKEECHQEEGRLHWGFVVMVFDENDKLMLAQRSRHKRLWPLFWDGTVAGHHQINKAPHETVAQRLREEIGISGDCPELMFSFRYQAKYKDIGTEHELCDVYQTRLGHVRDISPVPTEVAEFRFVSLTGLAEELRRSPQEFTPWFLIASHRFLGNRLGKSLKKQ